MWPPSSGSSGMKLNSARNRFSDASSARMRIDRSRHDGSSTVTISPATRLAPTTLIGPSGCAVAPERGLGHVDHPLRQVHDAPRRWPGRRTCPHDGGRPSPSRAGRSRVAASTPRKPTFCVLLGSSSRRARDDRGRDLIARCGLPSRSSQSAATRSPLARMRWVRSASRRRAAVERDDLVARLQAGLAGRRDRVARRCRCVRPRRR